MIHWMIGVALIQSVLPLFCFGLNTILVLNLWPLCQIGS